jgi:hypothetical protein
MLASLRALKAGVEQLAVSRRGPSLPPVDEVPPSTAYDRASKWSAKCLVCPLHSLLSISSAPIGSSTEKDDLVAADIESLQPPAPPRSGPRKRCERHILSIVFTKAPLGLRELVTLVTAACRAHEKCETHS